MIEPDTNKQCRNLLLKPNDEFDDDDPFWVCALLCLIYTHIRNKLYSDDQSIGNWCEFDRFADEGKERKKERKGNKWPIVNVYSCRGQSNKFLVAQWDQGLCQISLAQNGHDLAHVPRTISVLSYMLNTHNRTCTLIYSKMWTKNVGVRQCPPPPVDTSLI